MLVGFVILALRWPRLQWGTPALSDRLQHDAQCPAILSGLLASSLDDAVRDLQAAKTGVDLPGILATRLETQQRNESLHDRTRLGLPLLLVGGDAVQRDQHMVLCVIVQAKRQQGTAVGHLALQFRLVQRHPSDQLEELHRSLR